MARIASVIHLCSTSWTAMARRICQRSTTRRWIVATRLCDRVTCDSNSRRGTNSFHSRMNEDTPPVNAPSAILRASGYIVDSAIARLLREQRRDRDPGPDVHVDVDRLAVAVRHRQDVDAWRQRRRRARDDAARDQDHARGGGAVDRHRRSSEEPRAVDRDALPTGVDRLRYHAVDSELRHHRVADDLRNGEVRARLHDGVADDLGCCDRHGYVLDFTAACSAFTSVAVNSTPVIGFRFVWYLYSAPVSRSDWSGPSATAELVLMPSATFCGVLASRHARTCTATPSTRTLVEGRLRRLLRNVWSATDEL